MRSCLRYLLQMLQALFQLSYTEEIPTFIIGHRKVGQDPCSPPQCVAADIQDTHVLKWVQLPGKKA